MSPIKQVAHARRSVGLLFLVLLADMKKIKEVKDRCDES
jgi:hypothetical protein